MSNLYSIVWCDLEAWAGHVQDGLGGEGARVSARDLRDPAPRRPRLALEHAGGRGLQAGRALGGA